MRICFFFFLIVFLAEVKSEYHFKFNTKLICNNFTLGLWGYNMQYFDQDVAPKNGDDPITQAVLAKSKPGSLLIVTQGQLEGDEFLSKYFNVKLLIFHTCNPMNERSRVDVQLRPQFEILSDRMLYEFTSELDLTDFGGLKAVHGNLVYNVLK